VSSTYLLLFFLINPLHSANFLIFCELRAFTALSIIKKDDAVPYKKNIPEEIIQADSFLADNFIKTTCEIALSKKNETT